MNTPEPSAEELKLRHLIAGSAFFDAAWYLADNPDVAQAGVDPVGHYLLFGWREGRQPSTRFDGDAYLRANPDVAGAGINPLVHYELRGRIEGRRIQPPAAKPLAVGGEYPGWCSVCRGRTVFKVVNAWLRDGYLCSRCGSKPRNRALMCALDELAPGWEEQEIHESSPGGASSEMLAKRAKKYSSSQYFPDLASGKFRDGVQCQNLERMSLPSKSVDIFITQDVFEHVMRPERAFGEIARVLKPGGRHIFTVPWYPELEKTRVRARISGGRIVHLEPEVRHNNPVDDEGTLVVRDWGRDLPAFVRKSSGMETLVYLRRDREFGIDGEFLHVFVSSRRR